MKVQVAVLGFHKIGPPVSGGWETWNYVSVQEFWKYLKLLADEGWSFISMDELVSAFGSEPLQSSKCALITFDDGYRSTLTNALPCLQEFGAPGAVFVPTDFIGGFNDFDRDVEPQEPMCTWEDLQTLSAAGVSVEAHSVSHRTLSGLEEDELNYELSHSRQLIEQRLQRRVRTFAYPYGDSGHSGLTADRIARAGYALAFEYGGGCLTPGMHLDRYRLPRLAMGPDCDLLQMLAAQ